LALGFHSLNLMLHQLDKLYPLYGFSRNTGNISPAYLAALAKYGPSPSHHPHNRIVQAFVAPAGSHRGEPHGQAGNQ
jgi:hypothetical protein